MAVCKSLRHIFDTTIPENKSPSLIDSLSSLNHIKTYKPPLDHHSFTEIFGELHFKESPSHPASQPPPSTLSFFPPPTISSSFPIDLVSKSVSNDNQDEKKGCGDTLFSTNDGYSLPYHRRSESLNSDSLQLCTEGLGSESLGDVEDLKIGEQSTGNRMEGKVIHLRRHSGDSYFRKKRSNEKTMFPPPISYIGQAGKPTVSFQSYRQDGRFVLKEIRIPTQECLRASRKDGRLRLSFVQPNIDDDDDDNDNEHDDDVEGGEEKGETSGVVSLEEEEEGVKEVDEDNMNHEYERDYMI